ncbi:MAG: hypothetical protein LLG05_03515 [Porphyromonadaceae bacterium]|nr:hypothetical protein [Porphyromonadaceae bacterium]
MGQSLENLSQRDLPSKSVFNNRFVVEICEKVHVHYRNLRINLSLSDWKSLADGFKNSVLRWIQRGEPQCGQKHIELTRKEVVVSEESRKVLINLNKNLYKCNEGRIFAEGADLKDDVYIHFKIGDIRMEFTINEFLIICDAIKEAETKLKSSDFSPNIRQA